MTNKKKTNKKAVSMSEIDDLVTSQAGDDNAWDEPIRVKRKQDDSLSLPAELVKRAAFLAKLHKERDATAWLRRIIAERIELEESAFMEFKRTLAASRAEL